MKYTDKQLVEHELHFWIEDFQKPFYHEDFYKEFFNFNLLKGKNVLDIGCGGSPVSEYTGENFNLTVIDPIIDDLVIHDKYKHLLGIRRISDSVLNVNETGYDVVCCLNVIDHFNDENYTFIDKFKSFLKIGGQLWLYYDVRDVDSENHLAIDNDAILSKIGNSFDIIKKSDSINPKHRGWSHVNKSIRIIAIKLWD